MGGSHNVNYLSFLLNTSVNHMDFVATEQLFTFLYTTGNIGVLKVGASMAPPVLRISPSPQYAIENISSHLGNIPLSLAYRICSFCATSLSTCSMQCIISPRCRAWRQLQADPAPFTFSSPLLNHFLKEGHSMNTNSQMQDTLELVLIRLFPNLEVLGPVLVKCSFPSSQRNV